MKPAQTPCKTSGQIFEEQLKANKSYQKAGPLQKKKKPVKSKAAEEDDMDEEEDLNRSPANKAPFLRR
jgi:hypothetical protein